MSDITRKREEEWYESERQGHQKGRNKRRI